MVDTWVDIFSAIRHQILVDSGLCDFCGITVTHTLRVLLKIVMRYISATEAKRKFAATLDAFQLGPVVIRRRSRDQAVLIAPQEYARLRGIAVADFQAFCDRVGEDRLPKA